MEGAEIRQRFIDYFVKVLGQKDLGHVEVPSSPLVPERHPTLLFVNSGMVQFTPYFLGEKDPVEDFGSARLCSVQKCVRTNDLPIVGMSKYHLTFFEMMGSWSIGDYGKKKAVEVAFDLLTNKDYGYGLDPKKFHPTVFKGNDEAPLDKETIEAWVEVGVSEKNVSLLSAKENWWAPAGLTGPGPCGPCTEVLYDRGPEFGEEEENPGATDNPRYLEIWNAGVFMQFDRDEEGTLSSLQSLSVDTGAGLERFAVLMQGVDSVYETDLLSPIVDVISKLAKEVSQEIDLGNSNIERAIRRSTDHLRAVTFMISESVYPSNSDQGYVLRKLLRTVFSDFNWTLKIEQVKISDVISVVCENYNGVYTELSKPGQIVKVINEEYDRYQMVADNTRRFIRKNYANRGKSSIDNPFDIYQSTGASVELIKQLADELGIAEVDEKSFNKGFEDHQKLSKKGAGGKFKGGLADHSEETTKFHTATHLLHASLRKVLGEGVQQKGSNITTERLRFDFSHHEKLTEEEISEVESMVNEQIDKDLGISYETMTYDQAIESGALAFFGEKYGDKVKVYTVGDPKGDYFSREVCGGPHVTDTGEIGRVRINKQEKLGANAVRIYMVSAIED